MVRLTFEFEGEEKFMYIVLPVLQHGKVWINDAPYYPILPIVERGGLHVSIKRNQEPTVQEVSVKVLRSAALVFSRSDRETLVDTSGRQYRDYLITAKIHQGRGSKHKRYLPLALYHMALQGLSGAMQTYGLQPGQIEFVSTAGPENDGRAYFVLPKQTHLLSVDAKLLEDMHKRRFVISLHAALRQYPWNRVSDVWDPEGTFFKVLLGTYINPNERGQTLFLGATDKHFDTNRTLFDPLTQKRLKSVNVDATDLYDLMRIVYFNIDNWLTKYEPTNLYRKQIGSLDLVLAPLVPDIVTPWFTQINNDREPLTSQSLTKLMRPHTSCARWVQNSPAFAAAPTIYGDNPLMIILADFLRIGDSSEGMSMHSRTGGGSRRAGASLPQDKLLADPSYLPVTSLMDIPTSNPCAAGTINPFLQVDADGNIIRPLIADTLTHVFD
jgi:hypothetical protein